MTSRDSCSPRRCVRRSRGAVVTDARPAAGHGRSPRRYPEKASRPGAQHAIEQARTRRPCCSRPTCESPASPRCSASTANKGFTEHLPGRADPQLRPGRAGLRAVDRPRRRRHEEPARLADEPALRRDPRRAERTCSTMIVIDTPPLELVSDALPIGLQATGMIYVVKSARHRCHGTARAGPDEVGQHQRVRGRAQSSRFLAGGKVLRRVLGVRDVREGVLRGGVWGSASDEGGEGLRGGVADGYCPSR